MVLSAAGSDGAAPAGDLGAKLPHFGYFKLAGYPMGPGAPRPVRPAWYLPHDPELPGGARRNLRGRSAGRGLHLHHSLEDPGALRQKRPGLRHRPHLFGGLEHGGAAHGLLKRARPVPLVCVPGHHWGPGSGGAAGLLPAGLAAALAAVFGAPQGAGAGHRPPGGLGGGIPPPGIFPGLGDNLGHSGGVHHPLRDDFPGDGHSSHRCQSPP